MATVYIVTQGDYSDYRIRGVFDSRELADLAAKAFGGGFSSNAEVEEWVMNEHVDTIKLGLFEWLVRFDCSGGIEYAESTGDLLVDTDRLVTESKDYYGNDVLRVRVLASDEDHARKIACDKRAEYLAAKQGIS